ncbi:MAG: transposase IS4 family [Prolixibacteraceae bacterium]|nr:MAG: transposase IS4 family [Prolixibacteraceae bacterium]
MFIKVIPKIDRNTGKAYNYYQLCESYRLGGKVRHRSILSLGNLIELSDNKDFKLLADRIEQLVCGNLPLYPTPPVVEALAHRFYNQIIVLISAARSTRPRNMPRLTG